ncbi:MAG: hypothetical protein DCC68_11715 [Planctomycetota bacterium]|nr:MAG: hypothetical protein DCC68_11715 [Planctomycetota bacterium]
MRSSGRERVAAAAMVAVLSAVTAVANGQQGFTAGVGLSGGDSRAMFDLFGSQGSGRGPGMMSSSVTTLDGRTGYFAAGSLVPFVTGVVPVVGEERRILSSGRLGPPFGPPMSNLADRIARLESQGETLGTRRTRPAAVAPAQGDDVAPPKLPADDASTAVPAVDSIAAIRRARQAEKEAAFRAAAEHFDRGAGAEREGKAALAAYHYKIAQRDGDDATRKRASERLAKLPARK